jgi:hypothetical protein
MNSRAKKSPYQALLEFCYKYLMEQPNDNTHKKLSYFDADSFIN